MYYCYNIANITGGSYVGGIVGCNYYYYSYYSSHVNDCYNVGMIHATTGTYVGGIAGQNKGDDGSTSYAYIRRCYNVGDVTSASGTSYAISYNSNGIFSNCYFLEGVATNYYSSGNTSLTPAQMLLQSVYSGFDFENVWIMVPNSSYPYPQLRDNIQDSGDMPSVVSIISLPEKTEYLTGDVIDLTGGMVKVIYQSGKEEIYDITSDMISGYDNSTVGTQTVTVTVQGVSDTFTVNMTARPVVTAVSVIFQPDKKTFIVGTEFDFTGAVAQVTYDTGVIEYIDITDKNTTGGDINHIGKQTITFTAGDVSATFEVEVLGIAFDRIELTKMPDKLIYQQGEELDLGGMVITAVMNNGTQSELVSGYTVSGYDSTPGTKTVVIAYKGKSVTFDVTVQGRTLTSISLVSIPNDVEYIEGQALDLTGLQINGTYSNGDVETITDYTVNGYDSTPGVKTVVVTVGEYSVSFPVKVTAKVITEFNLVSLPAKLQYMQYEAFDKSGLKAVAVYNDGSTKEITDYTLAASTAESGVQTVTVAYAGFVQTFEINVTMKYIESIRITAPTKLIYYIGQSLDTTGLEVIVTYNDGSETPVLGYTLSGFDSATAGTKTVTVSYEGFTKTFEVAVITKTAVETGGTIKVGDVVGRVGDTVQIPVTVTQNMGLAGFCHTITFDPAVFTFVTAEANNGFTIGSVVINDEKAAEGEVTVLWFSAYDVTDSKTAYTLTFTVNEDVDDGEYDIGISFDSNDNGNAMGQDVIFTAEGGVVTVISYYLGDLDGDKNIEMADLLKLAQYVSGKTLFLTSSQRKAADVNMDGVIDIHDVTLLSQMLLEEDI